MNPAALAAAVRGDFNNAMIAATPGGIEAQEAAGQAALVASNAQLPKEIHGATRKQLEALGFKFGKDVDELFVAVTLPAGWHLRATSHSMHSDLLDDKGRKRAGIFYKAAFYDRRADMSMLSRYSTSAWHPGATKDEHRTVALDGETAIHDFGSTPDHGGYEARDALRTEAQAWLDKEYPQHADPLAYWD